MLLCLIHFTNASAWRINSLLAFLSSLSPDGGKPGVPKVKTRSAFKTGSKKSKLAFGTGGQSDLESVMTEDYENQFHNVMVKQVANVPIMTFDKFLVDSDVDTVRSQYIRDRFQAAMCKSASISNIYIIKCVCFESHYRLFLYTYAHKSGIRFGKLIKTVHLVVAVLH